jgi:LPS sulfotransferase NodH
MKPDTANGTTPAPAKAASPIDHWTTQGQVESTVARRGYVICATPRTGSYYLCDLLRSTGCLGRPHEYFGGDAMRRLGSADYPLDLDGQLAAALTDGRTANGVFGVKLFASQFTLHASRIMPGLGNPLPVFLEREDLLGQAISLTRAAQTKVFFASPVPPAAPCFDAALIRDYLELIVRWNAQWQLYFARRGITPLRLSYEQVVAAPQTAIDRIAAAIHLDRPAKIDFGQLSMAIQRDAISDDWRERFLADQPLSLALQPLRSDSRIALQRRLRRLARLLRLHND